MGQQGKHHILLIDDDPLMHDIVRIILDGDYRLTCCATVSRGLEVLRNDRPGLLLLDIMLSTPTEGLELAARLQADTELSGVPYVLVSSAPPERGSDKSSPGARGLAGAAGFLEKPLHAAQLRRAVAGILDT